MTPQEIVDKILEPSFEGDGVLANGLLAEFSRGFPKENIRRLIASSNPSAQGTAAFLMTFWGFAAHPFVLDVSTLLDSKSPGARFDAVEVLMNSTTPDDGETLGRMFLLMSDDDRGVQWKVAQFIIAAQRWQLRLAIKHAAALRPNSSFTIILEAQVLSPTRNRIRWLARHRDPMVRRFGAALASRPRHVVDESFLDIVGQSDDPDVNAIISDARKGHLRPIDAIPSSRLLR